MRTIAKYLVLAVLASAFLYCADKVSGQLDGSTGSDSTLSPDAYAFVAAVFVAATLVDGAIQRQDGGTTPGTCTPCLRRTVYSGTLDASGCARFTIPQWDPDDPPVMDGRWQRSQDHPTHPGWWSLMIPSFDDAGVAQVGCCDASSSVCTSEYAGRPYRVVVVK
jgi:hypothetical protein